MSEDQEILLFSVNPEQEGQRIDKVITSLDPAWTRMMVQAWIRGGRVLVNGQKVKTNYRLNSGEEVEIQVPPRESLRIEAEEIPLDIRYEDEDLLVVNKPRGMVVHPAAGNYTGTLVNALLYYCDNLSSIGGEDRPGIVHRIDKDTSGLIMIAKNNETHLALASQLKEHQVERHYMGFVHGHVVHPQGTIDAPIGRHPRNRQQMTVLPKGGKRAVTHFDVMERLNESTRVLFRLETGRTHQIRVHMKYIGHPLIGDPLYGRKKEKNLLIQGQALHAQRLAFTHPRTGGKIEVEAELPEDLRQLLQRLRSQD